MGVFEQFPYTNLHNLNLDWIIKTVKNMGTTIDDFIEKYGEILIAKNSGELTNINRIYLYVGHEPGYSNNYWYYFDRETNTWTAGGAYVAQQADEELSTTSQNPVENRVITNYIYDFRDSLISLKSFEGETNEDKLHNALNTVTAGVILCGEVNITKEYVAINKDYRKITILGATFNISHDEWYNQGDALYNSVPAFGSCHFKGNNNTIFNQDYNLVGPRFDNCVLDRVTVYNSETHYIQSPYFVDCCMDPVANLFKATIAYDLKMIGCRVESSSGTLITTTDNIGIRQGVIDGCLIEGRTNVVINIAGALNFTITNCYFEGLTDGLLTQTASAGPADIRIIDNAFFSPTSANYAVTLNSTAYTRCVIERNTSNYNAGNLLCNKDLTTNSYVASKNYNNASAWTNNGFPTTGGRRDIISIANQTPTWDADTSTWKYTFTLPSGEAYTRVHPFYVIFSGSYSGSTGYQGYLIGRITPRIAYSTNFLIVCDTAVIDSCNKNNVSKSSTATLTATLSTTTYNANNLQITVSIGGFTSARGQIKIIDPYRIWDLLTIPV